MIKAESILKKYAYLGEDVDEDIVKVALGVSNRRLIDINDAIKDPDPAENLVTEDEWKILGADELTTFKNAKKKHLDWLKKYDCQTTNLYSKPKKKKKKKKGKKKRVAKKKTTAESSSDESESSSDEDEEVALSLRDQVESTLA